MASAEMVSRFQTPETFGDDQRAFGKFYETHAPRVYALCLHLTGDPVTAGEVTQDVFVRVWRTEGYEERGRVRGWLARIAVNLLRDRARAVRRRRQIPLDEVSEPFAAAAQPVESRLSLERAVGALPARAREVLVLHDIEGFRMAEIAEMTGVTEGTVKSQLHRARHLLQEALR